MIMGRCERKEYGQPYCNITPILALKSPTSIILILVQVGVIVSIFCERILLFNSFKVMSVFPEFKLFMEGPGSWLGMDDAGMTEVRAIGSEVFGSVMMTDTAEVFWAVDLVVPFCLAVATGDNGAVLFLTTRGYPGFFRLGSDWRGWGFFFQLRGGLGIWARKSDCKCTQRTPGSQKRK